MEEWEKRWSRGNSSLVINYREKKKTSKKIKKQEEANDTAKDDKNMTKKRRI